MAASTPGKTIKIRVVERVVRLPRFAVRCAVLCTCAAVFCFVVVTGAAAHRQGKQSIPGIGITAATDISVIPKETTDTFNRIQMRDMKNGPPTGPKTLEVRDNCLLPPLSLMKSDSVAATTLAVPAKAKKEYIAACEDLQDKKPENAEKHLRKAVEKYPDYSLAWVTLGQLLATKDQGIEARSACAQGSVVTPGYVPAYLCLAELAAHEKAWSDVLRFSQRAMDLDPNSNAIAYEYNAAANLRANKLDEAEKSALKAVAIDKTNREPRIHFVLAQIYEAKGDRVKEAAELREYLEYSKSNDDSEIMKALAQLDAYIASGGGNVAAQPSSGAAGSVAAAVPSKPEPAKPPEPDPAHPSTAAESRLTAEKLKLATPQEEITASCRIEDVLPQVQGRMQEFVDNVQKFTATEFLTHESYNGAGHVAKAGRWQYDYVVSIEEEVPGMLQVNEFQHRQNSSDVIPIALETKGLPALALIFHPYYSVDFSMECEGMTSLHGEHVWQVRFRQREDKPSRIRSYRIGQKGRAYGIDLEGRAWFMVDSFQIVKLEADLVKTIPEIQLSLDHTSAEYAPVHFKSRGIDVWLPQAADLICERQGKRLHQQITFRDYLLFAVDHDQQISAPKIQE